MKRSILYLIAVCCLTLLLSGCASTTENAYHDFMNGNYVKAIKINGYEWGVSSQGNNYNDTTFSKFTGVVSLNTFDISPNQKTTIIFSSKNIKGKFIAALIDMNSNKKVKTFMNNAKDSFELTSNKPGKYCLAIAGYKSSGKFTINYN